MYDPKKNDLVQTIYNSNIAFSHCNFNGNSFCVLIDRQHHKEQNKNKKKKKHFLSVSLSTLEERKKNCQMFPQKKIIYP